MDNEQNLTKHCTLFFQPVFAHQLVSQMLLQRWEQIEQHPKVKTDKDVETAAAWWLKGHGTDFCG
jgi:hypothetical protein